MKGTEGMNQETFFYRVSRNKSCDEALGASQGSQGKTDLELGSLRAWVFELGWAKGVWGQRFLGKLATS